MKTVEVKEEVQVPPVLDRVIRGTRHVSGSVYPVSFKDQVMRTEIYEVWVLHEGVVTVTRKTGEDSHHVGGPYSFIDAREADGRNWLQSMLDEEECTGGLREDVRRILERFAPVRDETGYKLPAGALYPEDREARVISDYISWRADISPGARLELLDLARRIREYDHRPWQKDREKKA